MSRVLGCTVAAAVLSGALLTVGAARADARPASASCAPTLEVRSTGMAGREVLCRPAVRGLYRRPAFGAVRAPLEAPRLALPGRYVSLLILGVGY